MAPYLIDVVTAHAALNKVRKTMTLRQSGKMNDELARRLTNPTNYYCPIEPRHSSHRTAVLQSGGSGMESGCGCGK